MDLANLEVWRESEVNFPTDKFAKVRFLNDWYKEPKTRRPRRAYKERIGGVAATPPTFFGACTARPRPIGDA